MGSVATTRQRGDPYANWWTRVSSESYSAPKQCHQAIYRAGAPIAFSASSCRRNHLGLRGPPQVKA